jgi:hypothetical protein
MEIIEEKVILNGVEFSKSELVEIASFITLASDKVTYLLDATGTVEQEINGATRLIPKAQQIRANKTMQKALNAKLFTHAGTDVKTKYIIPTSNLKMAILRYR